MNREGFAKKPLVLAVCLLLAGGGYAMLVGGPATPAGQLEHGNTSTPSPGGTNSIHPTPPSAPASEVWFAPESRSVDLLDLFAKPDQWAAARAKVQVFKFYEAPILDPNLEGYKRVRAFSRLKEWGISIGIETIIMSKGFCDVGVTSNFARKAIQNVESNGGSVRYLALDEPLLGGTAPEGNAGPPCRFTLDQTASKTAQFINAVKEAYPSVIIGDIEPYPRYGVGELTNWMRMLERKGVSPGFFHLDIYVPGIRDEKKAGDDLKTLKSFLEARGIPFGIIFWGQDGNTDELFFKRTAELIRAVRQAIGRPQHSIFQSWTASADGHRGIPINLPENNPVVYSHTRLINEGLAILTTGH